MDPRVTRSKTKNEKEFPEPPQQFDNFQPQGRSTEVFNNPDGSYFEDDAYDQTFYGRNKIERSPQKTIQVEIVAEVKAPVDNRLMKGEEVPKIEERVEQERTTEIGTRMANITLTDALGRTMTPSTPKFISPPTYNPVNSNPTTFLQAYGRSAVLNAWGDDLKMTYLSMFPEGAAQIWYRNYVTQQGNGTKTWAQVKEDFSREFGGASARKSARSRWRERKQGAGEDIRAYYFDMVALQHEFDPNMTDEEFRDQFEEGLTPSLSQLFHSIGPSVMSMDAIKDLVFRISESQQKSLRTDVMAMGGMFQRQEKDREERSHKNRESSTNDGQRRYNGRQQNGQRNTRFRCYYCDKIGHFARECYAKRRDTEKANGGSARGQKNDEGRRD